MLGDHVSRDMIDFFINMPIFDRINEEEIKVIARHMNTVELGPNQVLFQESEKGNYVFFIKEGELDVIKKSETSGADVIIAILGKGRSVGEMSIIDDSPRSATIRARSHALLYILSKSAFDLILNRNPKIGIKLLKGISCLLSSSLRDTSKKLADYIPPLS